MTYRVIKYGLLAGLTFLTFYQNFPFGDYCSGLVETLSFVFLGGLFLLSFVIFLTIDLIKTFKKKRKFDFLPLVILTVFLVGNSLLLNNEKDKFWTDKELVGNVEVGDLRAAQIVLYSNQTFSVRTSYVDWSCTYSGQYSIQDNILQLERDDLEEETNNVFTNKYEIQKSDSLLIPLKLGIEKIKIKKLGTTIAKLQAG
tara:strand:- start:1159 stop:1755 length:597 start_codon:yes stop_codon:yes gene_type:complete